MRAKLGLLSPALRKKLRRRPQGHAHQTGGFPIGAEPEPAGKRSDGYVGCRPPPDYGWFNDSWPDQIKKGYAEAYTATETLYWQAQKGATMPEATNALIALGIHTCRRLEDLWRKNRGLVKSVAWLMSWIPSLYTKSAPPPGRRWPGEVMRSQLRLLPQPTQEEGRRGPKSHLLSTLESKSSGPGQKKRPVTLAGALLNDKIEEFVIHGVLRPNWLVWVTSEGHRAPNGETVQAGVLHETVIIDAATRTVLIEAARKGRIGPWAKAFAERYIRPYCPEILSDDGQAGAAAAMVRERVASLIRASEDDNLPWRAFKMLAQERLRKFMRQIEIVIGTN
jgi:hypothetical protein